MNRDEQFPPMVAFASRVALVSALALTVLLSGCTNDAGGQSASGKGSLAYNGASTGSHQSPISCDSTATVQWTSNLGYGSIKFTVLDGAGVAKYTKTVSSVGQAGESKDLQGAAGTWILKAERSGGSMGAPGWSGQYAAHISC